MSQNQELTLYTINMSHYSEKIRWVLDHEQISYVEQALTPAIHSLPMLIKGGRGKSTVPLVERGSTRVQDSPRIVDWLQREYGPLNSLPQEHLAEILEIQTRFDSIGKAVARYMYSPGFAHKELILDIWTQFAKPWEDSLVRSGYPLIKSLFKRKLKINPRDVALAKTKIDTQIKWLESRIQSGLYLVGDSLTVADITAAAMLAPLACPPQHPIYGTTEFRTKMASAADIWADSPALDWVRQVYAKHRGEVWRVMPNGG